MLTLRDIMTRDVVSVAPELPLDELVELFTARHIGGAPVVSGRKVVGVVSASDLLTLAAKVAGGSQPGDAVAEGDRRASEFDLSPLEEEELPAGYFTGVWDFRDESLGDRWDDMTSDGRSALYESTVADAMSTDVLSLPPETDVVAAAAFMKKAGIHRVLVIRDGELQGIVSSMDVLEAVANREIPAPHIVSAHEADFDPGWSHEPIVSE